MSTPSYSKLYGDSRRASRVDVACRWPTTLTEVARLPQVEQQGSVIAPHAVLVRGGRALVDYGRRVALFDAADASLSWHGRGLLQERWDGELDFHGPAEARMLAARVIGENAHAAYQFHHTLLSKDELVVEMFRIEPPADGSPSGWTEYLGDIGVAAVSTAGRTWAVVGRRVVAFDAAGRPADPPADPERSDLGRGQVVVEAELEAPSGYELSLIEGPVIVGAMAGNSDDAQARFADLDRKRGRLASGTWSSWVVGLDDAGHERWRVELPFAIRQPPVDGGGGRVLLCGDRVACVTDGSVRWEHAVSQPCQGTADASGSLVVAFGNTVSVLDAAGTVGGAIELEQPIRTPPAIDEQGDIWVATSGALYRGA